MREKFKNTYNQIFAVVLLLLVILILRLFALTIVEGNEWRNISDEIRVKEIPITAPRGEIRDKYGRVLASNKPSFTVQIIKNKLIDDNINDLSIKLLNILENNNEKYIDNFPIIAEGNNFYYTYQREIDEWLIDNDLELNLTAEEAFNALRKIYNISDDLDKYDAQIELQSIHNVYPPISVKLMKYTQDFEKENFLNRYNLEASLSAKEAFNQFKDKFAIDDSVSMENARKIMVVKNELNSQGYRQYQPVKIAMNVSTKTIITIEEKSIEMPGVEIVADPIREYPNSNLACHILGYLGKISEEDNNYYVNELGYRTTDLIGKDGIEKKYEEILKGKDGARYVEVDVLGKLNRVLKEEEPIKGENIYLTIDSKLQQVAEDSLKYALEQIQVGGIYKSKWGDYNYRESFKNATSGAVVALDAKTGEVLALANYPSFDPNLFSTGISSKDWKELQDKNPRDPLSPIPLFNVATRTCVQPGSTFKMITGLSALENGLDPFKKYFSDGKIQLGNKSFGCWIWNDSRRKHGYVDLAKAIEVSCNYYFYNISTSWDHYKNIKMSIDNNINKILEYAKKMGLGEKTGIEIGESYIDTPNQERKILNTKNNLRKKLLDNAKIYFEQKIVEDDKILNSNIDQIVEWTDENPTRSEILTRLETLGAKKERINQLTDLVKYSYYNQAVWGKGDIFNLAIGQGEHAYTPIQMANYIATLSNGGYKNKVSVIKNIEGEVINKDELTRIDLKDYNNLEYLKQGMKQVTIGTNGTAKSIFNSFPVTVAAKTGTAQKSGKIQPKDELEYLKKNLKWIAPYLRFSEVEQKAELLMQKYPNKYENKGYAAREAIKQLSNNRVNDYLIDMNKEDYDSFAWFVSFAPYDDPQIAVVALIFQGGHGGYAAPIAKDVIAEYLGLNNTYYETIQLNNSIIK